MRNTTLLWLLLFVVISSLVPFASAFISPAPTTKVKYPYVPSRTGECCTKLTLGAKKNDSKKLTTKSRRRWLQTAAALGTSFFGVANPRRTAAATAPDNVPAPKPKPPQLLPKNSALLDPTVLTLAKGPRTIHIVGTAHVSGESATLAGKLVRETHPDAVFLELDAARMFRAFKGGIPPTGVKVAILDDTTVGRPILGVTQKPGIWKQMFIKFVNHLSNPYKKLEMAGIPVGQEFVKAVKAGIDNKSLIILGDQRLDVTYKRLEKAMRRADKKKLERVDAKINQLMKEQIPQLEEWQQQRGKFRRKDFKQYIESMKTIDTTTKMMDVFKTEIPEVWKAMVGERDVYMARNLNALPSQLETVVAVMGLGHLRGVQQSLQDRGWKVLAY